MKKLNINIKEKPIVTALLIAVIIGLICLIIFVLKYFEPARENPPMAKIEGANGQVLELEPATYSWFYKGQEYFIEREFDPNNYDYSNCTIYQNGNNYDYPSISALPKTKFKKMFKTNYLYNAETGKYEQYESNGLPFEAYNYDVYLGTRSGTYNTYVAAYTMTYNQGRVTYVFKVVEQDNLGLGEIKEYKGVTLEQKDKIKELIDKVAGTEFLEDITVEDGKLNLVYKYRITKSTANAISLALFCLIDELNEIDFSHINTTFVRTVADETKWVQEEFEFSEPRIMTRESLVQEYNFSFEELKETLGL